MTVGHFCCVVDIEIDGCDMRRPIFVPMFTIMAILGWARIRGQSDNGVTCLAEIFFLRILETIPAEGTDGKEGCKIYLFLPVILYELWIHEGDREKKMSYRHLDLEESGCGYSFVSMCGDFWDSVEWCTLYYGRLQIIDGDGRLVTVLILEDCCDQSWWIRVSRLYHCL